MLELLDLAWIDGRSFWFGVLTAYAGPWLVIAAGVGAARAYLRFRRRRRQRAAIQALLGEPRTTATRSW